MNILANAIVSNSDMIKSYKTCREKAEDFGKLFIMKNNQPDAILFSVDEYERIAKLLEYLESLSKRDMAKILETLPKEGSRNKLTIEQLREDLDKEIKNAFMNGDASDLEIDLCI